MNSMEKTREFLRSVGLPGGDAYDLPTSEKRFKDAVVESIDGRMLVWIWYSSDAASTGSFLHFRRMHSAATRWRTYQIATSLGDAPDALADARGRLERFLKLGDCK